MAAERDSIYKSSKSNSLDYAKRPWRKLLWLQQPYPDNYVDSSFLSQLKRNIHVQQYSFWTLSSDSTVIVLHVCTVAIFVGVFVLIHDREWNPALFASTGSVCTLIGYGAWDIFGDMNSSSRISTAKSALLIVSTLLGLSPVLKSLTQSTSSDSIWAISFWLFLLNIIFHDYSIGSKKAFPPTLSTNLAVSASTMLASRLSTTLSVFSFLLFSIELFGLFPIFSRWIRSYSFLSHLILTAIFFTITEFEILYIGGWWALAVWSIAIFSAVFVAPGWLIALQQYKNEIQGPWDPAKPVLRNR
ncbi:phosphatidylinositol N-acetylglucosaminyltransferase subunit C [Lipomyces arxii]|uniref:phosphatidylinositol N-acetylglucosaminyltransferase subunit C n=1 Tax=Lipomyces arxii TaxID=56418 RepID=UPI0034CE9008